MWPILSIAAGMRWLGQDRDYNSYLNFYESLSSNLLLAFKQTRLEPGFVFLAWVSNHLIGLAFKNFLILAAAIALGIKFFLFFKRPYPWLLMVAYVPCLYLLHEMTQIRVALASAFFYLSVDSLLDKKPWQARSLFLIGIFFHSSFLIFLPLFIIRISWLKKEKAAFLYIIILTAIIITILNNLEPIKPFLLTFNPLTTSYIEKTYQNQLNYFSSQLVLLFVSCVGVFAYRVSTPNARIQIMIGIIGFMLFYTTASFPIFAHRLFEICIFSYFLWVTSVPQNFAIPATGGLLLFAAYMGYRSLFIDPLFF